MSAEGDRVADRPGGAGSLSPTQAEELDRACDRFEAEWRAGRRPRIEDHLEGIAEPMRSDWLGELIAVELDRRRRLGERPAPAEYHGRFPGHADAVTAAFGPAAGRTRPRPATPRSPDPAAGLLLGLLAFQNHFVDRPALLAALDAWVADKARPLGRILLERGALDAATHALLEALAKRHLEAHGGDPERSLAALSSIGSLGDDLARIGDAEVQASLMHLTATTVQGESAERTVTLGESTSGGGRFRVLRPHARGGLGAVFVALDEELHREVALKQILEKYADDATSRARFLLEAEVTGGLEHPGIVPVYGLGTHADGRPFYAMRFIRGDSLKEAADRFHSDAALEDDPGRRSLELRGLLRRFTDVCNAIGYAHSRGVLHRDIKPGNIIVGKHGETLVVDWGLAKATGRTEPGADTGERTLVPSSASGSAETLPGSALGTPAYMSPEQANGDLERLGPRSDVYSLGATLYYLLTGRTPVEGAVGAVLRAVRRGEFAPPRQLDATIDRALEAVCLKAMAHDPADRHEAPRALAEDVERWMADEPVSAWREPLARRARRWAKRNRTAVTGAAAALFAGVVGLSAVLVVQTQAKADIALALGRETQANRALAAANEDLGRSKAAVQARYDLAVAAIKTFHTGVSEDFLLREEGFKELRDRLLGSAADFYGKLGALLGRETDAASRRALAASNFELADLTARVGRKEEALAAHRAVLATREALAAEPGADSAVNVDVGRSLTAVAGLLDATGKTEDALAAHRRAETLLSGPGAADPSALAACRSSMGSVLSAIGRTDEALAAYQRAQADQEALAAAPGAPDVARSELAGTVNRIGTLLSKMGRTADAEAAFRRAVAIYRKLAEDNPAESGVRSSLARSHSGLGSLLKQVGEPAKAEAEYRRAISILQELAAESPAVTEFRASLAATHHNLGRALSDVGNPAAEAEFRSALPLLEKLVEEHPGVTGYRSSLADVHAGLGIFLTQAGQPAAEAEFRAVLPIRRKLAEDHSAVTEYRISLAAAHHNLGMWLSGMGRPAEAEAQYRAALPLQEKLARDHPAVTEFRVNLASTRNALGNVLAEVGRSAEAEAQYRAAVRLQQELAENHRDVTNFRRDLAGSHDNLGLLLYQTGQSAAAADAYRRGMAIWRGLAEGHPDIAEFRHRLAMSHHSLGNLLAGTGRPAEAEAQYRAALPIYRKQVEENPEVPAHRDLVANLDSSLSVVLRRLGRAAEARDRAAQGVAIREALVKAEPDATEYRAGLADNHLNRGLARRAMGDLVGAVTDIRQAATHFDALPAPTGEHCFVSACGRAALAGLAGVAGSGVPAGEGLAQADRAMALLRRASAMGYRNADAYRNEDALEPLRNRPDFRLLLMDLAMPDEPFAGPGPAP
jgi:serine/threonine-protein kinase